MEPRPYTSAALHCSIPDGLGKTKNDVLHFNNSIKNNEQMNTYFNGKNYKSKEISEKNWNLSTKLQSTDTQDIFAPTATSLTLSVTSFKVIMLSIAEAVVLVLSMGECFV